METSKKELSVVGGTTIIALKAIGIAALIILPIWLLYKFLRWIFID